MPFTGSHPAAVLPFLRWLPPSALVIGSMAPDFPYYVSLPVSGPTTHSWSGVVTIDVVLAAAAWALWRLLVGYAWAQYASGLIGGAALAVWWWRWWRRQPVVAEPPVTARWMLPTAWTAVVAATVAGLGWGFLKGDVLRDRAFDAATHAGAAGAAALVLIAVWWRLAARA